VADKELWDSRKTEHQFASRKLMTAQMVAMKYHNQWKATSKVSIETHDTLKDVTHETCDAESGE
jgi:hypothetical protein